MTHHCGCLYRLARTHQDHFSQVFHHFSAGETPVGSKRVDQSNKQGLHGTHSKTTVARLASTLHAGTRLTTEEASCLACSLCRRRLSDWLVSATFHAQTGV